MCEDMIDILGIEPDPGILNGHLQARFARVGTDDEARGRSGTALIASIPFMIRFNTTCCNWTRSPSTGGRAGRSSISSETCCFSRTRE